LDQVVLLLFHVSANTETYTGLPRFSGAAFGGEQHKRLDFGQLLREPLAGTVAGLPLFQSARNHSGDVRGAAAKLTGSVV
jgi:hypothetical protein